MPYDTAVPITDKLDMYQNKTRDLYPTTSISASRVPDLKSKTINQIFEMKVTLRVTGIDERDVGGGDKETYYELEIRQAGEINKEPEDMTSEEVRNRIESQTEEDQ